MTPSVRAPLSSREESWINRGLIGTSRAKYFFGISFLERLGNFVTNFSFSRQALSSEPVVRLLNSTIHWLSLRKLEKVIPILAC